MFKAKEKKHKVFWWDDELWGDSYLKESEIPASAIGLEDEATGEWVYNVERENYNGGGKDAEGNGHRYVAPALPVVADHTTVIHPSALFRSSGQKEHANLYKTKLPDSEAIQKGLLIAFVVSALVFTFLLVVVLIGGE